MLYSFLTFMLLGAGSAGFIMGKIGGMPPCFLCTVQQALLVGAGLFAFYRRVCFARFTLLITSVVALYHLGLQMNWVNVAPKWCEASFDQDNLKRSACSDKKAQIFNIPMPGYVFAISLLSMGLFGYASRVCNVGCRLNNKEK